MAKGTRICVKFSDAESVIFPDGLKASDVEMVREWIGVKNRDEWFSRLGDEDVPALRALLLISRKKKGDVTSRFADIDFSMDDIDAYFIDDAGREIEPDVVYDEDGDPVMKPAKDGIPARPRVNKNADGSPRWVYSDTKEPVPVPPTTQDKPTLTVSTD